MGRRNTFSRALKQLKSEEIDKKIQLIEALPTNNTMGVFSTAPDGYEVGTTTVSRETWGEADLDFDADGESDGTDTTGLFETDGTPKTAMPPGDTSYILGPMSAMYYGWWSGGTTTIGYIKQSDRRMQNLGTISGKLSDWDGTSFNSYGQLTLEQAVWFRDIKKKDDAGNDPANANYRAFYPGPPSNTPDANGRYLCTITGAPKDVTTTQNVEVPHSPTEKGEMSADDNFSAMADRAMKHGLSKKRVSEMSEEELEDFVDKMDALDADIAKYSKQQKDAEAEARKIAIEFGIDVALTLAGGWILKGIGKGLGFAYKGVKAANKARQINKAAKLIKAADKIDDAAAVAKATQAYNKTQKVAKVAQKANKAQKAAKVKQVNDANIFSRGRIDRSTPWVQRGASKAKSQKTVGQLFKDNIKGVDRQRTSAAANAAWNPARGMPGYAQAKSVVNPKIRAINKARVAKGRPRLTADQINPGGFQTGPDEASRRLFTGAANLAKKEITKSIKGWTGVAKGAAKIADPSARTITASVAAKEIQKLMGTNTNPKTPVGKDTTNKVINVLTDLIPPQLSSVKTPTKLLLGFLSGSLVGKNAGEIIPENDQISTWENLNIDPSSNSLSVGGHMQNVFGGEPLSHLTVDRDGNAVLKFNFAPNTNQQEFDQHPGRYSAEAQKFYNNLGTYAADLVVGVPIPGPLGDALGNVVGATASALTVGAKKLDKITPDDSFLGGIETGRNISGDIKIPLEKLKDIKPEVYEYLKSQQNTSSKWMPNKDEKIAYDPNKGTTVNFKHQFGAGGEKGATEVDLRHKGSEIYKYNRGEFQDPKNLDNVDSEIKTNLDKELERLKLSKISKKDKNKSKNKNKMRVTHYEPQGELIKDTYTFCSNVPLLESKKASRVLKNLKKPVVIPDTKQKKYKVKPGARMRGMDTLVGDVKPQEPYKKPQKIWTRGKTSQNYNARESQEKKNQVLHYVGASMDHWDYMTETLRKQGAKLVTNYKDHDYLYDYWLGGKKNKITRKEEVDGDFIVFMEDENGKKTTILQSKLNAQVAQNKEKEAFDEYYKLNPKKEPIPYENDPLFKKVSKRLKSVIDYEGKPATKGYPNEPPPKQIDGWHPDFGKRYKYDKLDPVSAKAMPKTGNPEIDANVEKAARKPK